MLDTWRVAGSQDFGHNKHKRRHLDALLIAFIDSKLDRGQMPISVIMHRVIVMLQHILQDPIEPLCLHISLWMKAVDTYLSMPK